MEMITLVCVVIMTHLAMKQFTVDGLALPSAGASAFWVCRGSWAVSEVLWIVTAGSWVSRDGGSWVFGFNLEI